MAHLDTFEYCEWVSTFELGVVQPRFKLCDFVKTKPREPKPKCSPHVHAGGEDEFAECLRAYGAQEAVLRRQEYDSCHQKLKEDRASNPLHTSLYKLGRSLIMQ